MNLGTSPTAALAEYLRTQARWREGKADEYPDDHCNTASAEALEAAADYVETVPDTDLRILRMRASRCFVDDAVVFAEHGGEVIRGYGSGSHGSPSELLDDLADAAMKYYRNLDDNQLKVAENRLRRMATRQGLRLEKSRRRDPRAYDYGVYFIVDGPPAIRGGTNWRARSLLVFERGMSLDEVGKFLTHDPALDKFLNSGTAGPEGR